VRPLLIALAIAAAGTVGSSPPPISAPAVTGLDHVPIAVGDLERAAADYRAMGFSLKDGRPHDNGIRNQHVKFPDGTELELITAPDARDELTSTYRRHLAQGDGPAFLALYAPTPDATAGLLERIGGLPYVFFGPRNASPTDRPEHFAHPNTATALIEVWLAGDDLSRERQLLKAVGAHFESAVVRVPDPIRAEVARLAEGGVVLLPGVRRLVPGRKIVGVTVAVRSLSAAARALAPASLSGIRQAPDRLWLPPSVTHGLWIELRAKNTQPG